MWSFTRRVHPGKLTPGTWKWTPGRGDSLPRLQEVPLHPWLCPYLTKWMEDLWRYPIPVLREGRWYLFWSDVGSLRYETHTIPWKMVYLLYLHDFGWIFDGFYVGIKIPYHGWYGLCHIQSNVSNVSCHIKIKKLVYITRIVRNLVLNKKLWFFLWQKCIKQFVRTQWLIFTGRKKQRSQVGHAMVVLVRKYYCTTNYGWKEFGMKGLSSHHLQCQVGSINPIHDWELVNTNMSLPITSAFSFPNAMLPYETFTWRSFDCLNYYLSSLDAENNLTLCKYLQ